MAQTIEKCRKFN